MVFESYNKKKWLKSVDHLKISQTKYCPKFTSNIFKMVRRKSLPLKTWHKPLNVLIFQCRFWCADRKERDFSCPKSESSLTFTYHKHNIWIVLFLKIITVILRHALVHYTCRTHERSLKHNWCREDTFLQVKISKFCDCLKELLYAMIYKQHEY